VAVHRMRSNGGQAGQRQLIDLGRRIDTGDVHAEALARTQIHHDSPVARIFVAVVLETPLPREPAERQRRRLVPSTLKKLYGAALTTPSSTSRHPRNRPRRHGRGQDL